MTSPTKDTVPPPTISNTPPPEEVKAYKRRLFETASRSYINDRLNVELPEHLHGEWIAIDDFSQYHAATKGFQDGAEYLTENNKLFQRPDGSTVGDVKFMVIPKWKYDAQQEQLAVEAARKSGIRGKAEVDEMYAQYAQSIGLGDIGDQSTTRVINGDELAKQLKR
jgi:hypothetical protein